MRKLIYQTLHDVQGVRATKIRRHKRTSGGDAFYARDLEIQTALGVVSVTLIADSAQNLQVELELR